MKQTTGNLFDDDPVPSHSLVQVLARAKPTSKPQQAFHRLVAKIDLKQQQVREWEAYATRYNQRLAAEMEPLLSELREGQHQMASLLDELLSDDEGGQAKKGRRSKRTERAKLRQLLLELLDELLANGDDKTLEALYDKHGERTREEIRQSEMEVTEIMLKDVLGLDLDEDHGASNAEELLLHAHRKMLEKEQVQQERAAARRQTRARKRSKAGDAEPILAAREQAAKEITQSIREIYRKLVGALHPDREQDASERQRKTELMQRVNQAYDGRDLLALLSLQLEIEQIDAEHLALLSAERLTHYTEILQEQLTRLEDELARLREPFTHLSGPRNRNALTPEIVDNSLNADLAGLRVSIQQLQRDMRDFRDPVLLREALRNYPLDEEFDGDGELDELIAMMGQAPRRKRKKRK